MLAALALRLSLVACARPPAFAARSEKVGALTISLKEPSPAAGDAVPGLLVLGGLETGARSLELIEPDRPVVLAAFDYPYDGPRRFRFPRTLLDARKIRRAAARTPSDIAAVHAWLSRRRDVDAGRACVLGASFGAPFALRAAADDPGLRCLILVEGFADVRGTAAHRMRQLWRPKLGPLARPSAWLLSRLLGALLSPPEPEADAPRLRAGQRVLVIEASGDTIIPRASRERLWSALSGSRAAVERVVIPGEHLLAGRSADQIRAIMRIVEDWLAARRG